MRLLRGASVCWVWAFALYQFIWDELTIPTRVRHCFLGNGDFYRDYMGGRRQVFFEEETETVETKYSR